VGFFYFDILITKTLTLDRFTSSVLIDENLSNDLLCRNLEFQNSKFGSRQGSLLGFLSRKPQTKGFEHSLLNSITYQEIKL